MAIIGGKRDIESFGIQERMDLATEITDRIMALNVAGRSRECACEFR